MDTDALLNGLWELSRWLCGGVSKVGMLSQQWGGGCKKEGAKTRARQEFKDAFSFRSLSLSCPSLGEELEKQMRLWQEETAESATESATKSAT